MRQKITTVVGSLISAIIAMLGFSCCAEVDEPNDPLGSSDSSKRDEPNVHPDMPLMYGCPYGEFQFSGLVTDGNDKAIDKVRVIVRPYGFSGEHYILHENECDTVSTDVAGKYKGKVSGFPSSKIVIVCEDPQGGYRADSVEVKPKYENGDDVWDFGVATAEVNFKLKKTEEN